MRILQNMFFVGTLMMSQRLMSAKIETIVSKYCKQLPRHIVFGIIETESGFKNQINKNEPNRKQSIGIMQMQMDTAKFIKCGAKRTKDLLDIEWNIACGCKYLKWQLNRYGEIHKMIASYNAGQAFTCKTGITKKSKKKCMRGQFTNQEYVNKVIANSYKLIENDIRNQLQSREKDANIRD